VKRIAATLIVFILAACTASTSPSPSASIAPSAEATQAPTAPTATPTSVPTVSPTTATTTPPEPTADLGDFICSYPYAVDGNAGRAHIDDVRVGSHKGYDRIVFQFEAGIPAIDVKVGRPPFTYDPSGLPMAVDGSDFLVFILRGGTGLTPNGRVTYDGPTDFTPDYPLLVQFIQAGDFEAQSEWVAGLTGPACIRVFTLRRPDRLVIDLAAK
jgi:hypothetical protein